MYFLSFAPDYDVAADLYLANCFFVCFVGCLESEIYFCCFFFGEGGAYFLNASYFGFVVYPYVALRDGVFFCLYEVEVYSNYHFVSPIVKFMGDVVYKIISFFAY